MSAIIGLALPLYLVTMASQNLSGLAVLKAAGYQPEAWADHRGDRHLFAAFGAVWRADDQSGGHFGGDLHRSGRPPRPGRALEDRAVLCARLLIFAVFGASLVAIFAVLPPSLIVLVAGLALMAPLANALSIALKDERERMAATTTFAVTASGLVLFGIGSAFWGLVAGPRRPGPRMRSKNHSRFQGLVRFWPSPS